jgi:hypothetical protein
MIHNQITHSMEVDEQVSIIPLEDKDHRGGIRVVVAFSYQLLANRNQKRLTKKRACNFLHPHFLD